MNNKRIAYVVGTGTIGEPFIGLLASFRKEVIGFSFTPQDGNSLLSSIAAAEWFLYPEDYEQRLRCIEEHCFSEI